MTYEYGQQPVNERLEREFEIALKETKSPMKCSMGVFVIIALVFSIAAIYLFLLIKRKNIWFLLKSATSIIMKLKLVTTSVNTHL